MSSIEPTIRQHADRQQDIDEVRRLWQQTSEDNLPGVPADEVLDRPSANARQTPINATWTSVPHPGKPPQTPHTLPSAASSSRGQ
jgi:hypothetical protein